MNSECSVKKMSAPNTKKVEKPRMLRRTRSQIKRPLQQYYTDDSDLSDSDDEEFLRSLSDHYSKSRMTHTQIKRRLKQCDFDMFNKELNRSLSDHSSKQATKKSNNKEVPPSTPVPKKLRKINELPTNWCVTQLSSSKYTFKWTVQNFSQMRSESITELSSSKFKIHQFPNIECKLLLYPNGHAEHTDNCAVCVVLQCLAQDTVDININVIFLNSFETEIANPLDLEVKAYKDQLSYSPSYCIKKVSKLVVKADVLIILCSLSVRKGVFHKTSDVHDVQVLQNKLEMSNDLLKMTKDKDFCDVILCVDKKEFLAHKAILVARSSFFKAMFDNKETQKYYINNVKSSTFKEILNFMYTGKILNLKNSVGDLFEASNEFNLPDLKIMCERYLLKNLSLDNVLEYLILADKFKADELKQKAKNFILAFSAQFVHSSNFKLLKNLSPDLYQEILCHVLNGVNT